MRKLFLIKNPEVFQGEKYLESDKDYFEGWYFKNTSGNIGISFIPGISISKKERKAFIQVITNESSYYVDYDINDFKFGNNPFYVSIGNSYFSKDRIHIDIRNDKQNLSVYGDLDYTDSKNIDTSEISPNIMGIFSYVPFMECNHAVISMKHSIEGTISINDREIVFNKGIGYIEKDWGISFPSNYIWCQGNNFSDDSVSFMLSIADIPFKIFSFRGLICSLIIDNHEYRFATYNGAKIVKYDINGNMISIVLKKGDYLLEVSAKYEDGFRLSAPVNGNMSRDIVESISSDININLKNKKRSIFSDRSSNCGLEVVRE